MELTIYTFEDLAKQTRALFEKIPVVSLDALIQSITDVMGVDIRESYGTQRGLSHARAMIIYSYMAKEFNQFTLKEIARAAGVQHPTVIHHLREDNRAKKFTGYEFFTIVYWVQLQLLKSKKSK